MGTSSAYLVKKIKTLVTSNGKPYQLLDLISDQKSKMKGIVWAPESVISESEGSLHEGVAYVFDAEEVDYKGDTQLNIHWAERTDLDRSLFMNKSKVSPDELMDQLRKCISVVKTPSYRAVVKGILSQDNDFFDKLKILPKTVNYDYSYPGGLLQSVVRTVQIASQISETLYFPFDEESIKSRDLLITAAFVCDLGKIVEISSDFKITDEGCMLGHQYLGCQLLKDIDKETDYEYHADIIKLCHCIMTHHIDDMGNWSTLKVKFREADMLRLISHMVFKFEEWNL
jgi:3'-5' exoribonuclease